MGSEALLLSGFRQLSPAVVAVRASRARNLIGRVHSRNGTSQLIHTCYTQVPPGCRTVIRNYVGRVAVNNESFIECHGRAAAAAHSGCGHSRAPFVLLFSSMVLYGMRSFIHSPH